MEEDVFKKLVRVRKNWRKIVQTGPKLTTLQVIRSFFAFMNLMMEKTGKNRENKIQRCGNMSNDAGVAGWSLHQFYMA